jgi:ribonuclease T2
MIGARLLAAAGALVAAVALAASIPGRADTAGRFDSYILALSWSPTWCAGDDDAAGNPQCDPRRDYGFVVHGLWPTAAGGSADYCNTADRWLAEDVIRDMRDLMPSRGLIIHQWKKHGTCSGLPQRSYFALIRTLAGRLAIPPRYQSPRQPLETTAADLVAALAAANPRLPAQAVAVRCKRQRGRETLAELRICYDRQGRESRCPGRPGSSNCRGTITLPAAP